LTTGELHVWSSQPGDVERWLELWRAWPQREVYAHPGYLKLYEDEKSRPLCAAWTGAGGTILYPFLLRDLTQEPFCPPTLERAADLTSPYGYGGPFFWGDGDPEAVAAEFWPRFGEWADGEAVVSEFVRLALFPGSLLPYPGERVQRLVNVVRDLDPDPDQLWMDFEHKVRKNVKKAQRFEVRIELDETGARLADFLRIYRHTLGRREADERYDLPAEFFESLQRELPGQFLYAHALWGDRVVSSELVLVSAETIYSFLGGTEKEAYELRPNDLLKHELILWAREAGKRRFVLGGGYREGDGIFRYKRSFAPHGLTPFFVGRRILEPALYRELTEHSGHAAAGDYFPAYRA
jgi:hypothetical protein